MPLFPIKPKETCEKKSNIVLVIYLLYSPPTVDYYSRYFKTFHSNITVEEKLLKMIIRPTQKAFDRDYIPNQLELLGLIWSGNLYRCQLKRAIQIKSDKGVLKES